MSVYDAIRDYNLRLDTLSLPRILDFKVEDGDIICSIISNEYEHIAIPKFVSRVYCSRDGLKKGKELTNLKSIKFGEKIDYIGSTTFAHSIRLEKVENTDNITELGNFAFWNCLELKEISLRSLEYIGNSAFCNCSKLERVVIGDNLKEVEDSAFFGCETLSSIELPAKIKKIGFQAFMSCGLTKVRIPANICSIGDSAFNSCKSLREVEFYGEIVKGQTGMIREKAFKDCRNIKEFTIPDGITSIGVSAFENCTQLEYIVIGESVTNIRENAFKNCNKLKEVHIKSRVLVARDPNIFGKAKIIKC